MRSSSRLAGLGVLLAALALPAGALAQSAERFPLVVDRSMAGVQLNMTKDQVRSVLGSPTESRRADDPFGRVQRWYYGVPKTHYYFRTGAGGDPVVTAMLTRRGFVRGPRGSGVGTPERALRERISGLRCSTLSRGRDGRRTCHTGEFTIGQTVTDFRLRRGRVDSILLGIVID